MLTLILHVAQFVRCVVIIQSCLFRSPGVNYKYNYIVLDLCVCARVCLQIDRPMDGYQ